MPSSSTCSISSWHRSTPQVRVRARAGTFARRSRHRHRLRELRTTPSLSRFRGQRLWVARAARSPSRGRSSARGATGPESSGSCTGALAAREPASLRSNAGFECSFRPGRRTGLSSWCEVKARERAPTRRPAISSCASTFSKRRRRLLNLGAPQVRVGGRVFCGSVASWVSPHYDARGAAAWRSPGGCPVPPARTCR